MNLPKFTKEQFHRIRKENDITCQQIADIAKVTKQSVSNYDRSEHMAMYLTYVLKSMIGGFGRRYLWYNVLTGNYHKTRESALNEVKDFIEHDLRSLAFTMDDINHPEKFVEAV